MISPSADSPSQIISGRTVHLRHPSVGEKTNFIAAAGRSRALHKPWVAAPSNSKAFKEYLARAERPDVCAWLVFPNKAPNDGTSALAGVINFSQIFHGAFQNAYLGFYAFEPYAGRGLMRAGLALALRDAFKRLGLHRIEANIQPGNNRSKLLVQSLGFECEGFSPRYLKIAGRWRDHERWALRAEDFEFKNPRISRPENPLKAR